MIVIILCPFVVVTMGQRHGEFLDLSWIHDTIKRSAGARKRNRGQALSNRIMPAFNEIHSISAYQGYTFSHNNVHFIF